MKNFIRNNILETRKNMDSNLINNASNAIIDKILNLKEVTDSKNIMLYLDFRNEVKMDRLVYELKSQGKTVCSPITIVKQRKLIPVEITNLEDGVSISNYGIREPLIKNPHIEIKSIDLVIVPGVAFDINKYRVGYGAGFYDRFLEGIRPDTKTIGVAFDFQVLNKVPTETHDKQLNMIITDKRTIL